MHITENNPSTWFCEERNVRVVDDKKNIFFFHPNIERSITFNLPKGEYFTANKLQKKSSFIAYDVSYKGFSKGWLNDIEIYVCNNANKATIFPESNPVKIFIDKKIAYHAFKPLTMFVISHEVSHLLPEGKGIMCNSQEKNFCDLNGGNYLLTIGLNPSQ